MSTKIFSQENCMTPVGYTCGVIAFRALKDGEHRRENMKE